MPVTQHMRWRKAISEPELVHVGGFAQEVRRAGLFYDERRNETCRACGKPSLFLRAAISESADGQAGTYHVAGRCRSCHKRYGITGRFAAGGRKVTWRADANPLSEPERLADYLAAVYEAGADPTGSMACLWCVRAGRLAATLTLAFRRTGDTYHGAAWCDGCGRHIDAAARIDGEQVEWLSYHVTKEESRHAA